MYYGKALRPDLDLEILKMLVSSGKLPLDKVPDITFPDTVETFDRKVARNTRIIYEALTSIECALDQIEREERAMASQNRPSLFEADPKDPDIPF